jgi:CRP-like cAMP-binding protein
MALTEIIRAAEIIEEEKSAAISNDHLTTWQELALTLSSEEFTSLYHAMTTKSYATGEMIAKQGEFLSTLFFVNRGRVQLYAVSQGREVALKTLSPGEIMGAGTFFEVSVWTVNAKSMGAELSLLHHKNLQSLKETHPALESKLSEFCAKFESSNALFKDTRRTRRTSERKKLSGRTTIALLNKQGETSGVGAKGDLLDISKGGVSFCLHFSKKETASTFLGQAIRISIRSDISIPSLVRDGKVVAVRCHDFIGNEYSLHVRFDTPMNASEVQRAIQPTQ